MILFRYLLREILATMAAVTVVLMVIIVSGRFVKYLAQAAAGDLAPELLLQVIVLRLPSFLELVLPLALFVAILLAYGRMYVDSEMTVMNMGGLSVARLASYSLVPAIFVAVLVAWISLFVSPAGIDKVQRILEDAKSTQGAERLVEGHFRMANDSARVSYVAEVVEDGSQMRDIFIADVVRSDAGADELAVVVAHAGQTRVDGDSGDRYLELLDGVRYVGRPGESTFQITAFSRYGQRLQDPSIDYAQKNDARPTAKLLNSTESKDQATLQWRISLALLVPVVALIAQALARTNPRRGRFGKMFPAFLLYMLYLVLLNAAREMLDKSEVSPLVGLWWVHAVFLALALALLFAGDAYRRLRASLR
ncbi:MAG: LPS export ABC transporter permease LptF [Spongiibacteraceae bacterium]|nr:LPS export ABC transporter permease LptF [Spongiibacteraceae bacterium]